MTARVPELAALPVDAVLDGELVALGEDGWPRPGERDWIKLKNQDYWRYPLEQEAAMRTPQPWR
jgi:hypothetical protein